MKNVKEKENSSYKNNINNKKTQNCPHLLIPSFPAYFLSLLLGTTTESKNFQPAKASQQDLHGWTYASRRNRDAPL